MSIELVWEFLVGDECRYVLASPGAALDLATKHPEVPVFLIKRRSEGSGQDRRFISRAFQTTPQFWDEVRNKIQARTR